MMEQDKLIGFIEFGKANVSALQNVINRESSSPEDGNNRFTRLFIDMELAYWSGIMDTARLVVDSSWTMSDAINSLTQARVGFLKILETEFKRDSHPGK